MSVTINTIVSGGGNVSEGGGGSFGYLGSVASEAEMLALGAVVGNECLRSDVGGTGGTRYELTALPSTTAANWQPIQGSLTDSSVITLALVDGKLPRWLRIQVGSSSQVTDTIGGVTQPVLTENVTGGWHEIKISDDPTSAQPTIATVQRTNGSATCYFSLEGA